MYLGPCQAYWSLFENSEKFKSLYYFETPIIDRILNIAIWWRHLTDVSNFNLWALNNCHTFFKCLFLPNQVNIYSTLRTLDEFDKCIQTRLVCEISLQWMSEINVFELDVINVFTLGEYDISVHNGWEW